MEVNEKFGNHDRPTWMINGFRDVVLDCNLVDIPLDGHPFTWFKSLGTERAVEVRLDRAMVNSEWWSAYPKASLTNLVASVLDHSPILLNTEKIVVPRRRRYNFRFENSWLFKEELEGVVSYGWRKIGEDNIQSKLGGVWRSLLIGVRG